jgi:cobalt-zinc-cadmium efflux system protein
MSEPSAARRLIAALVITAVIFTVQLLGALFSGSLALLSNAGHLFTDVGSLTVALYAAKIERRSPTEQLSYGFGRSGIVAAFVNGLVLGGIGAALVITGVFRLFRPTPVQTGPMIVATAIALILNILQSRLVFSHHGEDFNRQSVYWHTIGDSLSSLGILIAALAIRWTGWTGWDALAAITVGAFILWSSYKIGRPSVLALMEATPATQQTSAVRATLLAHPQVADVHHLHMWLLAPGYHALSVHVRVYVQTIREGQHVIAELQSLLSQNHHIQHVTIQLETDNHPIESHQ